MKKLIYQDWIVQLGYDPNQLANIFSHLQKPLYNQKIIKAVRKAVDKLKPAEKDFIERYYFQGYSIEQIALDLNLSKKNINVRHHLALIKLRKYLALFVKEQFGLETQINQNCLICNSVYTKEINRLIRSKKKEETWKRIIRILKEKYKIKIKSPQILIGHQKYHL